MIKDNNRLADFKVNENGQKKQWKPGTVPFLCCFMCIVRDISAVLLNDNKYDNWQHRKSVNIGVEKM